MLNFVLRAKHQVLNPVFLSALLITWVYLLPFHPASRPAKCFQKGSESLLPLRLYTYCFLAYTQPSFG